jgi:hypothetical protein
MLTSFHKEVGIFCLELTNFVVLKIDEKLIASS